MKHTIEGYPVDISDDGNILITIKSKSQAKEVRNRIIYRFTHFLAMQESLDPSKNKFFVPPNTLPKKANRKQRRAMKK